MPRHANSNMAYASTRFPALLSIATPKERRHFKTFCFHTFSSIFHYAATSKARESAWIFMFSELGGVRRGGFIVSVFFIYFFKLSGEQITAAQSTQNYIARTKGE